MLLIEVYILWTLFFPTYIYMEPCIERLSVDFQEFQVRSDLFQ